MSWPYLSKVVDDEDIDSTSKFAVMVLLAQMAGDDGRCYPSMTLLARRARLSKRRCRAVVAELEEAGLVQRIAHYKDNEQQTNRYQLYPKGAQQPPIPPPMPPNERVRPVSGGGIYKMYPGNEGVTPVSGGGRSPAAGGEDAHDRGGEAASSRQNNHIEITNKDVDEPTSSPTPQQRGFGAVCFVLGFDPKTLTKSHAGMVAQTWGILSKAGYSPGDILRWYEEVWKKDWRYRQGTKHPTVKTFRAEIGKLPKAEVTVVTLEDDDDTPF